MTLTSAINQNSIKPSLIATSDPIVLLTKKTDQPAVRRKDGKADRLE
jgi:hypothetical protein